MSNWVITYWTSDSGKSDIERWYSKLDKEQARSITKEIRLLARCGNELRLPHSRSLGKKLFELRERSFGLRIYYAFKGEQIIILLTAGDKTTQKNDIAKARKRL